MPYIFNDNIPIYLQIIEDIKIQIINEKLKPNDQVESVRNLAFFYGVNPNTIQRALVELEREGLMKSERTSGRFISINEKDIKALKLSIAKNIIQKFLKEISKLDIDKEEIIKMIGEESDGK